VKIFKNKSLNIALALSLTMSTCYTQAFWSDLITDKKNLALGFTIILITCTAVYKIFKSRNTTNDQESAADNALSNACESGDLDEVKRLYAQGANLAGKKIENLLRFSYYDLAQITKNPMYKAITNGNIEVIKFLLDHGVNSESIIFGVTSTPMYVAIDSGNLETVRCLVENGANIHSFSFCNRLLSAILDQMDEIVDYLIDNGALVSANCTTSMGGRRANILDYWTQKHGHKYAQYFIKPFTNGFLDGKYFGMFFDPSPPNYEELKDLLKTYLYKNTSTIDLEEMVNDLEDCPCCLRQRALAVLCARYKQNDPSLLSKRKTLRELFGTVPFNESFLKDLHRVNAIKFVVQNNITDKFGRDAVTACTQCCQNEDVIDAITANHFQTFGARTTTRPEHALRDLRSLLAENQDAQENEKGPFEEMLQRTKKRNKKVYGQLLNRTCVYAQLGQTEFPGEISSHIVSFLDSRPTNEVAEENEDAIVQ